MNAIADKTYGAMGLGHATASRWLESAAEARTDERGQGTVEYIGLVLLLAAVAAALTKAGGGTSIGGKVINAITGSIDSVK